MKVKNITIISTSHIAKQSVDEIRKAFGEAPGIVCVELDIRRLHALLSGERASTNPAMIRRVGVMGYLFVVIGAFLQRKLGAMVGMVPGQEMLTAVEEANRHNAQLFFIDQDVEITLRRLSQEVTFREKMRMVKEILAAPLRGGRIDIDLSKVPEKKLIRKLTRELKKKFPALYKVLVEERNEVMAKRIRHISEENPDAKILVVVGAGHTEGLARKLKL